MTLPETMRKAIVGEITVRTWWGCHGLTGEAFRRWFLTRLEAKINRHDHRPWRKQSAEYQVSLMRDANRVRDITGRRIIHRQFETDVFRTRLGHLLTKD
jgi:hypothetical protein